MIVKDGSLSREGILSHRATRQVPAYWEWEPSVFPDTGMLEPRVGKSQVRVTVILPAYNEAEALPEVLSDLFKVIDQRHDEVIVVDDASTDETAVIAARFPCRVIRHTRNRGKGAAMSTGLGEASGHFVIFIDADNTYPAAAIPTMLELSEQYDFVRCTRVHTVTSMPLLNRLGNKLFDLLLTVLHGLDGTDHLSGLYGLKRDALRAMDLASQRFDIEVEIGIKAKQLNLRSISVPVLYGERLGEKKLRALRDGWTILRRTLIMVLTKRTGFANQENGGSREP